MDYTRADLERHFDESNIGIKIYDEDGINMENAEVRRTAIGYIYCDDIDGYEFITKEELQTLTQGLRDRLAIYKDDEVVNQLHHYLGVDARNKMGRVK
jgi:hypothetical protein